MTRWHLHRLLVICQRQAFCLFLLLVWGVHPFTLQEFDEAKAKKDHLPTSSAPSRAAKASTAKAKAVMTKPGAKPKAKASAAKGAPVKKKEKKTEDCYYCYFYNAGDCKEH